MEMVFAIGISILSLALVVLITLQPRQQQSLSTDATSNLGKPSYWRSHRGLKNPECLKHNYFRHLSHGGKFQ